MRRRIRKDHRRFRRIIKGRIREDLEELISRGSLAGKKGGDTVKIPVKDIDIPEFRYDPRSAGGLGSGDGKIGQPVKPDQPGPEARPGSGPGRHYPEVEIEFEELADILEEELELPRIETKEGKTSVEESRAYRDRTLTGPETLLIKKRAYKKGLLRQALMNSVEDEAGVEEVGPVPVPSRRNFSVTPVKEDKEYLYPEEEEESEIKAVIFFMRDISGSMTGEKTEIIRQENYLIDVWLQVNYPELERVYLVHDVSAKRVSEDDFYRLSTGGGTRISSVYELAASLIDEEYPCDEWNIYNFHFSDGENFREDTKEACLPVLRSRILPRVNLFGCGQVSPGKEEPGGHLSVLNEELDDEKFVGSVIPDGESVLQSIKAFLGS